MTDKEKRRLFVIQTDALLIQITKFMKAKTLKLYDSSGIDRTAFSAGRYTLSKIIITASLRSIRDFFNIREDFKEEIHNLELF